MKVEGWLKRSRKEKRAHWPNFYIFYHLSYEKLFLSIFSSSLGSSYAHSLLKMDHISKCIFLPLQRALVRVRCRKYCQYFRIGMKQDLFSPWSNHSWYRLLGFSLPSFFHALRSKKNALVCVLKSLEWNQGKTMLDSWTNFFEKRPPETF